MKNAKSQYEILHRIYNILQNNEKRERFLFPFSSPRILAIYLENKYGIRLENELLCVLDEENEYGRFLKFESVTFAPIDLDGIEPSYMTEKEREALNSYHAKVYEVISPYLEEEEKVWLKQYTRPI